MARAQRREPPFSIWYVKEYESYLEDMAKEGKRFVGENRFVDEEGRTTTYRIVLGPRNFDGTLLAELHAKGWSYAGPINKWRAAKSCWHVFAAEDVEAPDSYFRRSLEVTLRSLTHTIWTSLAFQLGFSAILVGFLSFYWRSFFFTALPRRSIGEVFFYGYLIISDIVRGSDSVAARKYVRQVYELFGVAYTPLDWRQLAARLKVERVVKYLSLIALYSLVYFSYKLRI